MKIKLMKIKTVLATLLLMVPQSVLAEAQNNKNLISGFTESLSIAGEAITMKVPRNMVLQENQSRVGHEGTDASILVFESDTQFKNKLTYQYEAMNPMSKPGHVDQIEKARRSQLYNVKAYGGKTKRLRGRAGTYHIQKVTFSYYEGQQPKAVTTVSIHDGAHRVTVTAEVGESSIKKAVAKSKQLAKQALSVQRFSEGSSSIWYYLGVCVVIAAASAIYVVHSILTPIVI